MAQNATAANPKKIAKMTAAFHIAFNVVPALIFIGLHDSMARLLKTLLPDRLQETDP